MQVADIHIDIERKPIKHIHLAVYPPDARVHVSAPDYLDDNDIEAFVLQKLAWIQRQRDEILAQPRQTIRHYVSGEFLLLFCQRLLLAQELQLVEVLVESGECRHVYLLHIGFLHHDVLFGGIVDYIFQHVILLYEHRLGIVVLHAEVLQIHVHALHVHAQRHVIVMERLRDVAQFLQSFDVVFDYPYLFFGVLCQIEPASVDPA